MSRLEQTRRAGRIVHNVLFTSAAVLVAAFLSSLGVAAYFHAVIQPVLTESMSPAVPRYALVVSVPVQAPQIKPGDIVVFSAPPGFAPPGSRVMHRVTKVATTKDGALAMATKGDHNPSADPWQVDLNKSRVYRVIFHVPGLGVVPIFTRGLGNLTTTAPIAAGLLLVVAGVWYARRSRRSPDPAPPAAQGQPGTTAASVAAEPPAGLASAHPDLTAPAAAPGAAAPAAVSPRPAVPAGAPSPGGTSTGAAPAGRA